MTADNSTARPRRRWKRWLLLALVVVVLAPALVLFVVVWRFSSGRPVVARNYVKEINDPIRAIPLEERAWPEYRRIILELRGENIQLNELDSRPGWRNWPAATKFLEEHPRELATLRAAAARPHLGYLMADEEDWPLESAKTTPPVREADNPPMYSTSADGLLEMMRLTRLLTMDAQRAALAGDGGTAFDEFIAGLGLSRQLWEHKGTLIVQLVALTIFGDVTDRLAAALADRPELFTAQQLRALAAAVGSVLQDRQRVDMAAETFFFDDILQRMFIDDGNGDGRLSRDAAADFNELTDVGPAHRQRTMWQGVTGAWLSFVVARRQEQADLYRAMLAELEQARSGPMWQWEPLDDFDEMIMRLSGSRWKIRYIPVALTMPVLSKMADPCEGALLRRDATLAILAMHAFRLAEGRWPESLEELVPRYLAEVPVDRFDGQPLRYRLIDGQPRVYSIARNQRDDGGEPIIRDDSPAEFVPVAEGRRQMAASGGMLPISGDWVLWPAQPWPEPPGDSPANPVRPGLPVEEDSAESVDENAATADELERNGSAE